MGFAYSIQSIKHVRYVTHDTFSADLLYQANIGILQRCKIFCFPPRNVQIQYVEYHFFCRSFWELCHTLSMHIPNKMLQVNPIFVPAHVCTVCLECSEADFFLLAVRRRATYRWKGLVEAVDISISCHKGHQHGWFWCYWALKVKVISFGMYTFDGMVNQK